MVCLGVDTDRSSACLFGITIWRQDYMMVLVLSPPFPSLSESNTFQQCCTSPCSSTQWQLLTIMALRELILMAVTGSRRKCRPASVNSGLKPRRMGFSVEGEMCRAGIKLRPFCDLFILSNVLQKQRHPNQPATALKLPFSTRARVIRCFLFHIFYKVKFPNFSVWCKPTVLADELRHPVINTACHVRSTGCYLSLFIIKCT